MENAMALVEFDESEENNLIVCEEALQKIQNLPTSYGITATAIVGPGRIGKSSLLNWLVGKNVFKIGSKTSRVTKGIWMYIEEDRIRNLANIYIDVEGFGDPSKSNVDENDNRLLNIVTQICDVVLYNIRGVYDSDMLHKIKFVCSLFNRYRKGNAVLEKPILVSVLRDFDLDQPECPDTEFQKLFRQNPELLDTFRQTKAFTLVKPKEGKVIDLANTPDSELCEEFLQGRNEMKKYLTNNTKPLRAASNKTINGIVLAENIRRTVKHVNDDDLRMLSKSLSEILKEKNDVIKQSALETYKTEMRKKWPLPIQPETLMGLHEMEKNAAVEHIYEKCFTISGSIEVDEKEFKVDIENMFKEMQKDKCKEALQSAVSEIGQKLRKEEYFEDWGETCFHYDYDKAEKAYRECTNLGPEKLDIWQKYNEEMKTTKELIKQKAKVRDIEKTAAASEKENKEKLEKLAKENEKLEVKRKEFEKSQENDQILQGILGVGRLLVDCGRGITEMYRNVAIANAQDRDRLEVNIFTPRGSSASIGGASSWEANPSGGSGSGSSSGGARSSSPTASSKDTEL
ncbi:uncharacterized protein LOC132754992 [Ruditapes philippinarum]|uniref:uncharacterized protein LOC132754992 n=1 Tax=Ruditapes philippinarum TaxID=129788 RepID=UPI00295B98A2|nr:uncharacterized protein LOC132754992 [Ruditapes philippinarum]